MMADPVILTGRSEPPDPSLNPNNPTVEDCHSLPIPPLDPQFFSSQNPSSCNDAGHDFACDLGLVFDDNYDFDITFDDLENLYFPSADQPFLLPEEDAAGLDSSLVPVISGTIDGYSGDFVAGQGNSPSPESGSSGISGDRCSDVGKYLNSANSEAGSCNSGGQCSDSLKVLNPSSPASSQASGNDAVSPDYGNSVIDRKIKVEEGNGKSKRKKENEEANGEIRSQKYRRSESPSESPSNGNSILSEEEEKRRARLVRNRESAQLSRQRKKHYVEELEEKVRAMHSTIAELNGKISFFMAENASLRQQLSGPPPLNGMGMPATPMYPAMAPPMAYPWVPCSPYVVKPNGSQVPLVPIPRLKPQQPVPAAKARKADIKKAEGKTKKVASVSFLGLLFFILLFGGLVPIVDVKFGGFRTNSVHQVGVVNKEFYNQHKGRILIVNGHSNQSHEDVGIGSGRFDISSGKQHENGRNGSSEQHVGPKSGSPSNASEPLVASLYVPRNDKLVKIDGNLIIHAVLASEKAMAPLKGTESKNSEKGLAVPRDLSLALAIPDVGNGRSIPDVGRNGGRHTLPHQGPMKGQKALSSGSADNLKDHLKSSAADGKLKQWFYEGLAGPMLSSGMCTEVFQFDTSPAPGAIVPASSVTNTAADHPSNATYMNKGKNRRTLRGLPITPPGYDLNITEEHVGSYSHNDTLKSNESVSSMVVSVLVDPREAGDSEVDGMITPKSLSKIFVVVLLDSVKYVTYSCVLPRSGPHLVTT